MQKHGDSDGLDICLDIFGQQPGLNLFTQLCFCFPVPSDTLHPQIVGVLRDGLERLTSAFPWIAGQVVNEGSSEGNTGVFKIRDYERIPRLVVKDLRDGLSTPTMDALKKANFPMGMLDESLVSPRATLPKSSEASSPIPVFLVQATFIGGGLLLTFNGQHQAMDMTGQGRIIDWLAEACKKVEFAAEDLSTGNPDRGHIVPLLDDSYQPGPEVEHQLVDTTKLQADSGADEVDSATSPDPHCSWASVTFSAEAIVELKSLAMSTMPETTRYVSTDDVISAFIWQSVARVRLHRLSGTTASTFARAVDPRRYLGIPLKYPGLVQNMAYSKFTLESLVKEPLGIIAAELRSVVDPDLSNLGHNTQALATILSRSLDKSITSVTASIDLSSDIMLSSWANLDSYQLDFNLGLGKPEAVRRPQFDPVESLMYLMPKTLQGDINVAMCLRKDDLERLRFDEAFVKFGANLA